MEGGAVPGWARGTFCDSANSIGCTPDKRLVAYCDLSRWDGSLPSGYQYFEDPVSALRLVAPASWIDLLQC